MRLVVFGPPAAGKGTQADILSKEYSIPHISTGDIFRQNIQQGTQLGLKAQEYMNKGILVPDELVVDLVKDRIREADCEPGFILDGFPRTIKQAQILNDFLVCMGCGLDKIINIEVDDKEIVGRVAGRRVCQDCKKTYNINNPESLNATQCSACGGELVKRDDEHAILERLRVYHEQTKPLIEYYSKLNLVVNIDGLGSIDNVTKDIINALGR